MAKISVSLTGPRNGTTVSGSVPLTATTKGPVKSITFTVDGVTVSSPWNTAGLAGPHTVVVTAKDGAGQTAKAQASVTVQAVVEPPPSPPPPPPDPVPVPPPPPPPTGVSPNGTRVPRDATQLIDASGGVWTLSGSAVQLNGQFAAGGLGSALLWWSGNVFVLGIDTNWWRYGNGSWIAAGPTAPDASAPPPPPPPVPVDCQVSAWSPWVAINATTEQRTRTVLVPPTNGGAVCPSLVEQRAIVVSPPPPPPPPGGKRVLRRSDITYLGAWRMPPNNTDTTFAYGGLTGRTVNGKTRLFLYGNHLATQWGPSDEIYEVEVSGEAPSLDYRSAPRLALVTRWGNVYGGKRVSYLPDGTANPISNALPTGLFWNEAMQLLYWGYYDSYNVAGNRDWALGASSLDDPATGRSTAYGPWRLTCTDGDGQIWYGPWRGRNFWRHPVDGSLMCGSEPVSGAASSPWGPDCYGGLPWPTAATPAGFTAPDLHVPSRYLEHYFMGDPRAANYIRPDGSVVGALRSFRRRTDMPLWEANDSGGVIVRVNQALNGGVSSWTEMDGTKGAVWLDLPRVHGVLFLHALCGAVSQDTHDPLACHEWYATGLNDYKCSHGFPTPVPGITGPVSTAAFPALSIYNPDDLEAVKAGAKIDYTVEPTDVVNLDTAFNIRTADILVVGHGKSITGPYFDPATSNLYVLARAADDSRVGPQFLESLVHVFHIDGAN